MWSLVDPSQTTKIVKKAGPQTASSKACQTPWVWMKRKEPPTSTVTHCQPFCLSHTPCLRAGVQGHVLQKAGRACQRFLTFLFFLPLFLHHRFLYCLSTSSSSTHIPHPVKFLYEVLVKLLEHPKSGQFRMSGGRENNTRKQMWTKETR